MNLLIMRVWVTLCGLSLSAAIAQAADLPNAVTHSTFPDTDMTLVLLGRDLFYDPVLSGNRNISCASCHHPSLGTADGVSLSLGEGGTGLGPDRTAVTGQEPPARIPRNAPALWNLGAYEYATMFHDGRVELDDTAPFGLRMPADRPLERGLPSPLAAQAMLPPLSPEEMAGQRGENAVADAVARGDASAAWALLANRVDELPGYRDRFTQAIGQSPVHFTDIATALAEFITFEFQSINAPFDAYLNGDNNALSVQQLRGMDLFYGKADCATCHAGTFQTDHDFHAIAMPQLGPGKKPGGYADLGRQAITNDPEDRYRFRTPSLRNITETAPYGHSGAFSELRSVVQHHAAPVRSLMQYDRSQAILHDLPVNEWQAMDDTDELIEIAAATELPDIPLTEAEIDDIVAFLGTLTDPASLNGRLGIPDSVPSGLPVDR
ncbi:cytochrome-c peroxidase [Thalassovita sp.]|jgi:cytochrome c peroxidase|uniref:cytochrome-c peroxidase n=1 Tax=Thalassovita sp. TaxID=1979401 RepID=UPI003B59E632